MLKNKYIRISLLLSTILMVFLFAVVVVKINSVNISSQAAVKAAKINSGIKTESGENEVEQNDNASYFSIFRFVNNFIPSSK